MTTIQYSLNFIQHKDNHQTANLYAKSSHLGTISKLEYIHHACISSQHNIEAQQIGISHLISFSVRISQKQQLTPLWVIYT